MKSSNFKEPSSERDISIDYLRASVIVMVVFLHAMLAYISFIAFSKTRYSESPHPVVDIYRCPSLDAPLLFLDSFMMPLMFFLSGFFTLSSLDRKGPRNYFIARLRRLGVPFLFGIVFLAPISWWPAWKLADHGPLPYLVTFFSSDGWPIGPPWFLWVLLLFNGVAALMYRFVPLSRTLFHAQLRVCSIFLVTVVSYLSLSLFVPDRWISIGPFDVQLPRLALYFAYFVLGITAGSDRKWMESGPSKHWVWLLVFGMLSFLVYLASKARISILPRTLSFFLAKVAFAGICTGCSFGFIGASRSWFRKSIPSLDSLRDSSFGIYLIHYPLVVWLQYTLLGTALPVGVKFYIASLGDLMLSWGLVVLIRKIPFAREFL
jgi:glucans biosynthesis protein C